MLYIISLKDAHLLLRPSLNEDHERRKRKVPMRLNADIIGLETARKSLGCAWPYTADNVDPGQRRVVIRRSFPPVLRTPTPQCVHFQQIYRHAGCRSVAQKGSVPTTQDRLLFLTRRQISSSVSSKLRSCIMTTELLIENYRRTLNSRVRENS